MKDRSALATDHKIVNIADERELLDLLTIHVVRAARQAVDVRKLVTGEVVRFVFWHFIVLEGKVKYSFVLG